MPELVRKIISTDVEREALRGPSTMRFTFEEHFVISKCGDIDFTDVKLSRLQRMLAISKALETRMMRSTSL